MIFSSRARCAVGAAIACLIATAAFTSAQADEAINGLWAHNAKECADDESFNSRTYIDFNHKDDGKPAPIFDQYENHCRIQQTAKQGASLRLNVTCYEFWDDYRARKDGRAAVIRISTRGAKGLTIDGKRFMRCPKQP